MDKREGGGEGGMEGEREGGREGGRESEREEEGRKEGRERERWEGEREMGGRKGERRQCLLEGKHYLLIGSHSLLTGAWSIRDWRRQESYKRMNINQLVRLSYLQVYPGSLHSASLLVCSYKELKLSHTSHSPSVIEQRVGGPTTK